MPCGKEKKAMSEPAGRAGLPIGIFDSGVGGLTVLAALRHRLPDERYCYLGDTARLPYGTKSTATIVRYSLQATEKLVERRIKLLVIACNTATAAALPELRKAYAPLPIVGVVDPGARAACKALNGKDDGAILVLGTESTVNGQAYTRAIHALRPKARVIGVPCSLFVPLAEEGWMTGSVVTGIAERYLVPVLENMGGKDQEPGPSGRRRMMRRGADALRAGPDCVVLGCTHFPPLAPAIAAVVGAEVPMVDSAATTAEAVEEELRLRKLLRPAAGDETGGEEGRDKERGLRFLTTDAPERFIRVGSLFLGEEIDPALLELVTL
jgi:glutamate racemase